MDICKCITDINRICKMECIHKPQQPIKKPCRNLFTTSKGKTTEQLSSPLNEAQYEPPGDKITLTRRNGAQGCTTCLQKPSEKLFSSSAVVIFRSQHLNAILPSWMDMNELLEFFDHAPCVC